MKKNILFLVALLFVFISCQDPVFYNIRKEVSLVPATVRGSVNSIARYTFDGLEYLVAQNSKNVFYKLIETERTGDVAAWQARSNSEFTELKYDAINDCDYNGEYIIKLAADSANIYILTAVIGVDHDEGEPIIKERKLYYTNSLTESFWNQIEFPEINLYESTIFCTNAIKNENRRAYFRNGSDLYELNGETVPAIKLTETAIDEASAINSAVWFNGKVLFFGTLASTTNETTVGDATMCYYGSSEKIYYYDGSSSSSVLENVGSISCIAVTADALLFGCGNPSSSTSAGGGIYKVFLADGIPENAKEEFSTNADAALTSSYQILLLFSVYPEKKETDNIIYASTNFKSSGSSISVSYDNVGLWAYYPTRGNWNRE